MHSSFYHYEEVRARLYDIIRVLQAENPDVTILIEQMAPAKSEIMTPELESYFSNLQSLVQPRAASPPFSTIEIAGGDDNGCIECNAYTPETQGDMSNIQYPLSFSVPSETPVHWLDLRANTLPWHLDLIPVDFVSQSDRRIFTQIPALYDLRRDANEAPPTAWLVNSLDHLDDAFEWVSFDGTLYVSSNVSPDTVYIPMLTELIRIDNGQSMPYGLVDNPVKDLLFDNITFSGADYRML